MPEPSKTYKYRSSSGEQAVTLPVVRGNEVAIHCSSCGLSLELEADYRLQLGLLVTLGVGSVLAASLTALPSLLAILSSRGQDRK